MVAHADDLRYFYGESIGRSVLISGTAGASVKAAEPLEPGRYELRILDFGGGTDVWVRQGVFSDVVAAAAAPSTRFRAHTNVPDLNRPVTTFMVRAGDLTGLAVFTVGGTGSIVQITKVSRDQS